MNIDELRSEAREYIDNPFTVPLPQASVSQGEQPLSLASFVDVLGLPSGSNIDRLKLFETLVILEIYFVAKENIGKDKSDQDAVIKLCQWTTKALLPSDVFAERSPYAIGKKAALNPQTIATERALGSHGLSLLSYLLKEIPLDRDEIVISVFTCLASFSDTNDPWTTFDINQSALALIQKHLDRNSLSSLLPRILEKQVKPLFDKSKHPSITPQGRKATDPLPRNDVLHSDLDIETRPWKYHAVYIVTVFKWVLLQLDESSLQTNWALLIPPLLTLIDDSTPRLKASGCTLLRIFLMKCQPQFLNRTGLGSVFENALMPCLMYLPSLTEEKDSILLLRAAYPALIKLATVQCADEEKAKMKALGRVFRDGVLRGYAHAGEHVRVAEVLVWQITALTDEMGAVSVRHLKHVLPLLSANLAAPFATAYPPLLLASLTAMDAVIINAWPRVANHRGEMLRGLTICWCRIKEESFSTELSEVKEGIQRTVRLLTNILRRDGQVKEEFQILIDQEYQLGDLLII